MLLLLQSVQISHSFKTLRIGLMPLQVGVRVEEEDVQTGARHHCCSAYLTFVSVQARYGLFCLALHAVLQWPHPVSATLNLLAAAVHA